jgi:hypothetical protein
VIATTKVVGTSHCIQLNLKRIQEMFDYHRHLPWIYLTTTGPCSHCCRRYGSCNKFGIQYHL